MSIVKKSSISSRCIDDLTYRLHSFCAHRVPDALNSQRITQGSTIDLVQHRGYLLDAIGGSFAHPPTCDRNDGTGNVLRQNHEWNGAIFFSKKLMELGCQLLR